MKHVLFRAKQSTMRVTGRDVRGCAVQSGELSISVFCVWQDDRSPCAQQAEGSRGVRARPCGRIDDHKSKGTSPVDVGTTISG